MKGGVRQSKFDEVARVLAGMARNGTNRIRMFVNLL